MHAHQRTIPPKDGHAADTAIAQVLPAEVPLTPAQHDQVEQAVRTLNALATRTRLELAVAVSRYVLDEFFGGEWERFTDPRRNKSVSFRALCAHSDLRLSRTTLLVLVHVGRQVEVLPGQVAHALSVEHHRALLPLTNVAEREQMARLAVAQRWSTQELEAAVAQQLPNKSAEKTRRAKSQATQQASVAESTLRKAVTAARVQRELPTWSAAERSRFAGKVASLRRWVETMEGVLAGVDDPTGSQRPD